MEWWTWGFGFQDSETQRGLENRPPWAEALEARVPTLLGVNKKNFYVAIVN